MDDVYLPFCHLSNKCLCITENIFVYTYQNSVISLIRNKVLSVISIKFNTALLTARMLPKLPNGFHIVNGWRGGIGGRGATVHIT